MDLGTPYIAKADLNLCLAFSGNFIELKSDMIGSFNWARCFHGLCMLQQVLFLDSFLQTVISHCPVAFTLSLPFLVCGYLGHLHFLATVNGASANVLMQISICLPAVSSTSIHLGLKMQGHMVSQCLFPVGAIW